MSKQLYRKSTRNSILFCMNCGNEGIPIVRRTGRQRKFGHIKNLYCIYCKTVVGHIECKNIFDTEKFKQNYMKGLYKEQAENSIIFCKEKEASGLI